MIHGKLGDIAHARSGDKGSHANIGVIALNKEAYLFLLETLTAEKVESFLQGLHPQSTVRFELPNLYAFNFVLYGILDGGAAHSLRTDSQGKTLGQALLQLPLSYHERILNGK